MEKRPRFKVEGHAGSWELRKKVKVNRIRLNVPAGLEKAPRLGALLRTLDRSDVSTVGTERMTPEDDKIERQI